MMKPGILILGPMMPHVMAALERDFTAHRLWEAGDRDALLDSLGAEIKAVATDGHIGASAELMERLPALEIIACYGVGVDAIDLPQAAARGLVVTNTPDVLNDDVANMAIALLLATSRRLCEGDRYVRSGAWLAENMPLARGLRGRQVGILGLGRVGKEIAGKLGVFGCPIAYCGRRAQKDQPHRYYPDLTAMARDSDFLVVSCPGGEATRNLVTRQVLEALGPEGTLINVARGSVVEEDSLVALLADGGLGAAGLDVFADEPRVPRALLALDNVVLSPHQGSATEETRRAMGDLVVENLRTYFAGKPALTPVT